MIRSSPRHDRALLAALREHATHVAVRHLDEALDADVELLAWMDPLVEGKRFAFVGEGNHFVHEKLGYRLFMVRYLVSRGFGVMAEEIAWSDGVRIDRYFAGGDESWLDRVGTFGYEGGRRADRDDRPTGYLAQGRDSYPTRAFAHEHRRWLEAVRGLRASGRPPLRYFGLDVDYEPGAGYEHLPEQLAAAARSGSISAEASARVGALARPVPGETLADEVARLAEVRSAVENIDDAPAGLLRTVRSLHDGFRYVALVKDAPDLESLRPGMAFRETVMCDQFDDAVRVAGPDARFVVFGHNLHLARDDGRIERPAAAVGPGGDRVDSVGAHVHRRHAGEVFTVWMLDHEGRDSQPLLTLGNEVRAGSNTLNAALSRVGESFFVPAGPAGPLAAVLGRTYPVSMIYGHTVRVDLTTQVDALFFSRYVSPLQEPAGGSVVCEHGSGTNGE